MHFYTRHIGDYAKDTSHLTLLEHGAYTVLMDWCYASERPLPPDNDQLFRICRAFTKDEQRAVLRIVDEYFVPSTEGHIQKRIEIELQRTHAKTGKAKESAKARWQRAISAQDDDANAMRTQCERNANAMRTHSEGTANAMRTQSEGSKTRARVHYPLPITHYPLTGSSLLPESGEPDSSLPLTQAEPLEFKDQDGTPKKERGARSDLCFEFLVNLTGASMGSVTKAMRGEINAALRDIRAVLPEVTPDEMARRATRYRERWPRVTCSPSALAKHWGSLGSDSTPPAQAASSTAFQLVPADCGRAGPPEGWQDAMAALWGPDWTEVYASWDLMPASDQTQVRRFLAQKERGAAA